MYRLKLKMIFKLTIQDSIAEWKIKRTYLFLSRSIICNIIIYCFIAKKKRQEGITFKFDDVNWITIIKIDRIAWWIRETYASYSRNESSSTNSHTCAIPRLLFFHFAIRLKNSPTTFAACLERAPHGRSRYPPSYVWNDHLLVVRFHDTRSRPRGILDPDSRPPLTADIFFERSGRSFLHLVLLVFLVGENVSGGHTTGRERDLFLRRYTFTFTSPPRCFLSSVPLSPTSPSRSIRSPRSAYLRDSSCDAVSPPSLPRCLLFVRLRCPRAEQLNAFHVALADFCLINEPHPSTIDLHRGLLLMERSVMERAKDRSIEVVLFLGETLSSYVLDSDDDAFFPVMLIVKINILTKWM